MTAKHRTKQRTCRSLLCVVAMEAGMRHLSTWLMHLRGGGAEVETLGRFSFVPEHP